MARLLIPTDTSQATLGYLLADGTIVGSTSQAQDFGSNGIKANAIAESSAAAGVTIDSVLLKDNTVTANEAVFNDRIAINQATAAASRFALTEDNASLAGVARVARITVSPTFGGGGALFPLGVDGTADLNGSNITVTGAQFNMGLTDGGSPVGTSANWKFLQLAPSVTSPGPNVTTIKAIEISPSNLGNLGGASTAYGIHIEDMSANGGTTYGVFLDDMGTGTRYGFYQTGTNALNILNANVRIGSTSDPTVALDVTGAAKISSTLGMSGNITMATNSVTGVAALEFSGGVVVDGADSAQILKITNSKVSQGDPFSLPILYLRAGNGSDAGTDDDEGFISFWLDDSGGIRKEFARQTVVGTDVGIGSKDAAFEFDVMVADSRTKILTINGTGITVVGDVDGTTIGGITKANLVDKTAVEAISGAWSFSGAVILNSGGGDVDTQIKGENEDNTFFVDASLDTVCIGTATSVGQGLTIKGSTTIGRPADPDKSYLTLTDGTTSLYFDPNQIACSGGFNFDAAGGNVVRFATNAVVRLDILGDGTIIFNPTGVAADTIIEGGSDEELFFVDASTDHVGISTATPLSIFDVAGSFGANITAISSATTLNDTHHTVTCDASGGAFTVTLPAASGATRREYHIKKTDSSGNAVTVDGNSSETIDGDTTKVINVQYDSMMITSDGSNWHII